MAGLAFVLMIAGGVVVVAVLAFVAFVLLARWWSPADPRAGARTLAGVPVWFERDGQRFTPAASRERFVLGAADDCEIPGARPRHAEVRVFTGTMVDITPIAGAPLRVGGRRVRGATLLHEGDRVSLGAIDIVAHIGWLPDPDDPRIGTVVAGELLRARLDERRYLGAGVFVELFDPPIDPATHTTCVRLAQDAVPALLHVRAVEPGALVVDGTDARPHRGPLTPEQLFELSRLLAPLHAAGLSHGGLGRAVFLHAGRMQLWPISPTGTVADDMAFLRDNLPPGWPAPTADEPGAFGLAVLRHGLATRAAFTTWDLVPCVRCGEPLARRGPPQTTMHDGFDPATGQRFGGMTSERRTECLACGHVDVQRTAEFYR